MPAQWGDCVADVAPGSQLLITVANRKQRVIVPDVPGAELEIAILLPDRDERTSTAFALIGGGVVTSLVGLLGYAFARSVGGNSLLAATFIAPGPVMLVSGIIVGATGPSELRVEIGTPLERRAMRRDDLVGDPGEDRRREAGWSPPARAPVFGYALAF